MDTEPKQCDPNLPGQVTTDMDSCHRQNSLSLNHYISAEKQRHRRSSHDVRSSRDVINKSNNKFLYNDQPGSANVRWPSGSPTLIHKGPQVSPNISTKRNRSNSNKSLPHIVRLNSITSLGHLSCKRSTTSATIVEYGYASGEPPPAEKNGDHGRRKSLSPSSYFRNIEEDVNEVDYQANLTVSKTCTPYPSTSSPSLSNQCPDDELNGISYGHQQENAQQYMGVYYIRLNSQNQKQRVIQPVYCHVPVGTQVDVFLQELTSSERDAIRKFMEKEKREPREEYLWIQQKVPTEQMQDEPSGRFTILSLKSLENYFNNEQRVRRVKWRHLSMDKISVYRYSLPIITTKFRLRCAHFLAHNYRCCILGVWCMVIMCVSIGIVLSVVFGSTPHHNKQLNPSQGNSITNRSFSTGGGGYQNVLPIAFRQAFSRAPASTMAPSLLSSTEDGVSSAAVGFL